MVEAAVGCLMFLSISFFLPAKTTPGWLKIRLPLHQACLSFSLSSPADEDKTANPHWAGLWASSERPPWDWRVQCCVVFVVSVGLTSFRRQSSAGI